MITEPLICPQGLTVPELRKLLETWPDNDAETGEPNEVWFMTGDCLSSPVTCVDRLNRSDIVFGNDIESDVVNLSAENIACSNCKYRPKPEDNDKHSPCERIALRSKTTEKNDPYVDSETEQSTHLWVPAEFGCVLFEPSQEALKRAGR